MITDAGELAVAYDVACTNLQFITKLSAPGKALIATRLDYALGPLQGSILVASDPNTIFIVSPSTNASTHYSDHWTITPITVSVQNIRDFDYISNLIPTNQYLYMVNNLLGALVAIPQTFIAQRVSVVGSYIVLTTDTGLFELAYSGGSIIARPVQIVDYEGQTGWVESTFSPCAICELASSTSLACLSYYSANDFTLSDLTFMGLMNFVSINSSSVDNYGYNAYTQNADYQIYPLPQYNSYSDPVWLFLTWDINNVISLGIEINPKSAGTYKVLVQCNNCGSDVKLLVEDDPASSVDSYAIATSSSLWSATMKWISVYGQTDGAVIGKKCSLRGCG